MEITSRAQARSGNLARYFTGQSCNHQHICERYTANGVCVQCCAIHNARPHVRKQQSEASKKPAARAKAAVRAGKAHEKNRDRNLAQMAVRNKAYYLKNKERIKAQTAAYQRENNESRNAYKSKWMSDRAKIDPEFAMLLVMRKFVARMMDRIKLKRAQHARTTEIVGYTPAQFVAHIEPMFKLGMTWENHGKWHVDHRRPLSSFDLTDPEQRRMANSLHNLQPMWAGPNLKKSDSWSGQASLI